MNLFFKRVSLFFFILVFFHLLTPQSSAFQPTVGSWAFVGLNNYIIHSFAVDPNNSNILYAGTAIYGIFKSTDGGDTWNTINNGISNYTGYFTEIVVDPTNSNIVYAGGVGVDDGSTGILKSTDGGATWTYSHNGIINVGFGGPPKDVFSMIIDPTNHNTLYAAIGSRCGSVYKTTNAAATWTRGIGLACDPTVVRIDPFNSNILYTRTSWNQGIDSSIDGGVNWNNISSFGNYGAFYTLTIDPFNSSNLYANTDTGLYKSTDSGISWSLSNGALNNIYKALITDPIRTNTVYAGQNLNGTTGVSVTTDGGTTWSDINNGMPAVGIKRLLVPTNNQNLLYAGTETGIYAYGLNNNQSAGLNVPLFKQTDNQWKNQVYDSANLWSPSNPTINAWGCALTSAAMVFKYHGINKVPDGANLDPGTLNNWLKSQPDGYIRNGFVNWLALSRLPRLAKSINGISSFDALEYKRVNNYNSTQLTTDLNNGIPGILEEPGHFIVAKGINGLTFNINDPYYSRFTLNDYGNTFLSLGRFLPSSTDLSYVMLNTDPGINITLTDSNNNTVGESFTQQPLANDDNPTQTNSPIQIFYLAQPQTQNYKLTLSSSSDKTYNLHTYLYDQDGNVNVLDQNGLIGPGKTDSFTVSFDKQNSNNSSNTKIVTFQSLIDDINEAKILKLINNNGVYNSLLAKTTISQIINLINKNTSVNILNAMLNEVNAQREKGISQDAYQILFYDIDYLINNP